MNENWAETKVDTESGARVVPTLELTRDRSLDEVRLVANDISAFAFADELWEILLEFVEDVCRLLLRLPFAYPKTQFFRYRLKILHEFWALQTDSREYEKRKVVY